MRPCVQQREIDRWREIERDEEREEREREREREREKSKADKKEGGGESRRTRDTQLDRHTDRDREAESNLFVCYSDKEAATFFGKLCIKSKWLSALSLRARCSYVLTQQRTT